jgi:hypothetical protein
MEWMEDPEAGRLPPRTLMYDAPANTGGWRFRG